MATISQETWNKFTEKEKEEIRSEYKDFVEGNDLAFIGRYKNLFGEENLQPKNKTPKTWLDILNQTNINDFKIVHPDCYDKLAKKLEATYKIKQLIELGYGGMVTEEEWKDDNILKYYIKNNPHKSESSMECTYHASVKYFIAFHTQQQAEEFMSYPENVDLIRQYHMMSTIHH